MPEQVLEVAAGLVFRAGKLLITRRLEGTHLAGLWEFPGGKRECEETFQQCLQRELAEELGIEVAIGEQVEEVHHSYLEKTVHLRVFRCRIVSGEPQPIGCAELQWVSPDELTHFAFPAADERLLHRLQSDVPLWQDSSLPES